VEFVFVKIFYKLHKEIIYIEIINMNNDLNSKTSFEKYCKKYGEKCSWFLISIYATAC
jgi:hypothetical protein